MQVRAACVEEAGAIWRLMAESAGAPRWSMAEIRQALVRPSGEQGAGCSLVAVDGEVLVGVITVARVDEQLAEVEGLAVCPGRRRQGIGWALCQAAERWCASEGVTEIWLEVREGNTAARGLYEAMQWVEVGRRRAYYKEPVEDAVLLRRTVSQTIS